MHSSGHAAQAAHKLALQGAGSEDLQSHPEIEQSSTYTSLARIEQVELQSCSAFAAAGGCGQKDT